MGRDFEGDGPEAGEREWRLAECKLPLLTRRGEYPKETWFRFVQSVQLVATPDLEPRIAPITRHQTTTFRSAAGENRTLGPRMAFRTGGRAQQDVWTGDMGDRCSETWVTLGMPWHTQTHMSQRLEFVVLATGRGLAFSELCRRFGVSRKTGYKWLARYKTGGQPALEDRSRKPHRSP